MVATVESFGLTEMLDSISGTWSPGDEPGDAANEKATTLLVRQAIVVFSNNQIIQRTRQTNLPSRVCTREPQSHCWRYLLRVASLQ